MFFKKCILHQQMRCEPFWWTAFRTVHKKGSKCYFWSEQHFCKCSLLCSQICLVYYKLVGSTCTYHFCTFKFFFITFFFQIMLLEPAWPIKCRLHLLAVLDHLSFVDTILDNIVNSAAYHTKLLQSIDKLTLLFSGFGHFWIWMSNS